jgi:tRNA pseudouridine55 synthase
MHGWIIVDKPVGPGSTRIVTAVKRALRVGGYGKYKVGHGGTLDPLASGVLPIAIGEATKLSGRMLDADKAYDFTIGFGMQTDTLDMEGVSVATSDVRPTMADVEAILPRFTGPIEQVPPAYSALKIDGERAYDRARAGETFEIASRSVVIHDLRVFPTPNPSPEGEGLAKDEPHLKPLPFRGGVGVGNTVPSETTAGLDNITLTARVSKGTYIRSLARDIALALGTVGHVTMLRRTRAGPFVLDQAISLDKLDELAKGQRLEEITLPLTAGLDDIPALSVTPDQAKALREGRILVGIAAATGLHLAIDGDIPVALVEAVDREIRVVRGFNMMSRE